MLHVDIRIGQGRMYSIFLGERFMSYLGVYKTAKWQNCVIVVYVRQFVIFFMLFIVIISGSFGHMLQL